MQFDGKDEDWHKMAAYKTDDTNIHSFAISHGDNHLMHIFKERLSTHKNKINKLLTKCT